NLYSTPEGVHHARELHEHAVPGGLHDAAAVFGDLRVDESAAAGLELSKRPLFVGAHQAAIARTAVRRRSTRSEVDKGHSRAGPVVQHPTFRAKQQALIRCETNRIEALDNDAHLASTGAALDAYQQRRRAD